MAVFPFGVPLPQNQPVSFVCDSARGSVRMGVACRLLGYRLPVPMRVASWRSTKGSLPSGLWKARERAEVVKRAIDVP